MKKKRRSLPGALMYLLVLLIILAVVSLLGSDTPAQSVTLEYSQLLELVEIDLKTDKNEAVSAVESLTGLEFSTIDSVCIQEGVLYGLSKSTSVNAANFPHAYDFKVILPSSAQFYADVARIYESAVGHEVSPTEYTFNFAAELPAQTSWLAEWLPLIVSFILFGALWFFIMRQQTGGSKGVMSFGKSHARQTDPNKNKVTFKDVAGAEEEKEELAEVVEFLKDPKKFTSVGAKIPTGMLLVGPPGTGKTLLARAVAGEAGVPFFSISGSDFVEMFVGVGASRVRDLFSEAKKAAPAIIFIDEIDAVGRQRGTGLGGGHDEREQTLNQLLVEMDGFTDNEGVIVMAATNRSDVLDPALLRPGRFDRQIVVNRPDVIGREEILKVHVRNKPLADDVDLKVLARRTPGFTGADLMNVMNEAALLTARRNKKQITMKTVEDAISRVQIGLEKRSLRVTDKDRNIIAYHEAGHAIVSYYTPGSDEVHEISAIPRGSGAGGYTMHLPNEDTVFQTVSYLKGEIAVLMGGRMAETIIFSDVTTGASSDIKRATELARMMVTEFGMSEKIGPIFLGTEREVFLGKQFSEQNSGYSEKLNEKIDSEVHALITEGQQKAASILTEHRDQLDGLAALLIEREKITAAVFRAFMHGEELLPVEIKEEEPESAPEAEIGETDSTDTAESENDNAEDVTSEI